MRTEIDINQTLDAIFEKYFKGRPINLYQNSELFKDFNTYLRHEILPLLGDSAVPYIVFPFYFGKNKPLEIVCVPLISEGEKEGLPTPRYKNNCDQCEFLGCYYQYDLYSCVPILGKTLVVRYGDDYHCVVIVEDEFLKYSRTEEGYQYIFSSREGKAKYIALYCFVNGLKVNTK